MIPSDEPHVLVADALKEDPRIAEAKQLLIDAVQEHQRVITKVRPPNPSLKLSYEELLAAFAEYRGGKLWFPYLGSGIGNGPLVELLDGSVKYDFISGIGPHFLGHSNSELIASGIDAAISNTVMQGNLQQNGDSVELSQLLCKAIGMDHCFLSSSGAMSNENALKIAFQKRSPAFRILAFDKCFAGRTLALSQITDKPMFREGLPPNVPVDYIPFFDASRPEESTAQAIHQLKKHLGRHPKEYAVMLIELVQGEGGFYPGSKEFFTSLLRILKDNQVSILFDEIQTFGRTSALCAFDHFGLREFADIVTIGKLSQTCATLFNKDHKPKPALLSQTFTSSTAAIRASMVVINELLNGGYFGSDGKNEKIFKHFSKKLSELAKRNPKIIQGPFGIGAMIAFTPFDGDSQVATKTVHALFEAGVMSFIAGSNPTRIRFLVPSGVVTFNDIDAVVQIVEETLLKLHKL